MEGQLSGRRRSRRSSDASSSSRNSCHRHRSSTPISTKDDETDEPGHLRHCFNKRSPDTSLVDPSPSSRPTWVILNITGARRDNFSGDRTTSATSRTSNGDEISISFDLVEPPGISVLTVDWPGGPSLADATSIDVIAAHGDVVLFKMSRAVTYRPFSTSALKSNPPVDYFIYQASSNDPSRRPSLSLLPAHYHEHICTKDETGIMSCRNKEYSSFVVAHLWMTWEAVDSPPAIHATMFRSEPGEWKTFTNLHVHGSHGGHDLRWWHTDAVVPDYRRWLLMWVDYYRGMILLDMSPESEQKNPPQPRLRYMPLPVDTVSEDPNDIDAGRRCPEDSRSVCATRHGIKFVSVDHKSCSNFGIGHARLMTWKWNHTFRITTWSLREDDYTWRKDVRMYEEEFWATFGSGNGLVPRVLPKFPVVDMENPDAVCFQLKKSWYDSCEPTWMVEVDMKKKVMLAGTAYSRGLTSCGGEDTINSARVDSYDLYLSSELPRYLDDGEQDYKKRKQ